MLGGNLLKGMGAPAVGFGFTPASHPTCMRNCAFTGTTTAPSPSMNGPVKARLRLKEAGLAESIEPTEWRRAAGRQLDLLVGAGAQSWQATRLGVATETGEKGRSP
jgi:hypothetical protein